MLTCAIDEAGRGPIIGPMVMAGVLVDHDETASLKSIGVKDSKLLSQKKRLELYEKIVSIVKKHKILPLSPEKIDDALNSDNMNLNWLEARSSAEIINALKPARIVIDSPSHNTTHYRNYLVDLLDNKEVSAVVENKADLNHVECAAASILAKVAREKEIEKIKKRVGNFGSGYMSDPKTARFLEKNYNKYPDIFRKTWAPYKKISEMNMNFEVSDYGK